MEPFTTKIKIEGYNTEKVVLLIVTYEENTPFEHHSIGIGRELEEALLGKAKFEGLINGYYSEEKKNWFATKIKISPATLSLHIDGEDKVENLHSQ